MANPRVRRLELSGAVLTGAIHANIIANLRIGSSSSINFGSLNALAKSVLSPSYLDVSTVTIEQE